MEARIPTTKYGLRKRYRWVCLRSLYINIMAKRRRGRSGWRRRRRRGRERRKERRGDGDIRLVGRRPRYIREPSAVWRAFRTTMLSLRWDQIVGEGNEHISRDPAVKAQQRAAQFLWNTSIYLSLFPRPLCI